MARMKETMDPYAPKAPEAPAERTAPTEQAKTEATGPTVTEQIVGGDRLVRSRGFRTDGGQSGVTLETVNIPLGPGRKPIVLSGPDTGAMSVTAQTRARAEDAGARLQRLREQNPPPVRTFITVGACTVFSRDQGTPSLCLREHCKSWREGGQMGMGTCLSGWMSHKTAATLTSDIRELTSEEYAALPPAERPAGDAGYEARLRQMKEERP